MGNFSNKSATAVRIMILVGTILYNTGRGRDLRWRMERAHRFIDAACSSGVSASIGINNGQVASTNAEVTASGRVAEPATSP